MKCCYCNKSKVFDVDKPDLKIPARWVSIFGAEFHMKCIEPCIKDVIKMLKEKKIIKKKPE